MFHRFVEDRVAVALADTPVVLVIGPRRAGKTTLVQNIGLDGRTYLTLDDQSMLDAARQDPVGFVRGLDRVTIDEIQRAPELLLAVKKAVDEDYRPGRFLLTGSANVMTSPRVADSLAGRMETFRLLPLSRAEIAGRTPTFLDRLFAGDVRNVAAAEVGDDLLRLALLGGFPEAIARETERRRHDWARAYLASVLSRDLRDVVAVERLTDLTPFVRVLAEHSGQLVNYSKVGSLTDMNYKTAQRYVALLEQVFLITTLRPWFTNVLKRIVKTPKLHFLDSGILAATRGLTFDSIRHRRESFGPLLESFVYSEVLKLMVATDLRLEPYHFRDGEGHEVDLVLERDDGMIAGIEVKSAATVRAGDFAGLRKLADACRERFALGVVLYDGPDCIRFGDRLIAAPISCLWH